MAKRSPIITGASGEYYVAAYLSSMGLVVALPRAGIPLTDLLVTSEKGGRAMSVQVKTGASEVCHVTHARKPEKNYWMWPTSLKAAKMSHEALWYAFVFTDGWPTSGRHPEVFFVPSEVVARRIRKENEIRHGTDRVTFARFAAAVAVSWETDRLKRQRTIGTPDDEPKQRDSVSGLAPVGFPGCRRNRRQAVQHTPLFEKSDEVLINVMIHACNVANFCNNLSSEVRLCDDRGGCGRNG